MCLSARSRPADEQSVVVADNFWIRRAAAPGQSWDIVAKNKQAVSQHQAECHLRACHRQGRLPADWKFVWPHKTRSSFPSSISTLLIFCALTNPSLSEEVIVLGLGCLLGGGQRVPLWDQLFPRWDRDQAAEGLSRQRDHRLHQVEGIE